ncbi:MAG: hypothetical protein V4719_03320 [Planctomycetota bacterium]
MKSKSLCLAGLLLALPLLISGTTVAETPEATAVPVSPAEKIVQTILDKGYKRIAVLPRVVSRTTGDENRVTGKNTVGALSLAWPDELYSALIDAALASNGKFVVVTDQQVLQALNDKKSDDVGSEEMWKVIREKTGADFLASIDVTDPGAIEGKTGATEIKRVVNGVDLNNNSAVGRISQMYKKSLSDGAYAGESFIVREWRGNRLEATGLRGGKLFDVGGAAEKEQYANLVPQEHPLLRSDYPYGISIEVNGKPRAAKIIDGQFVVPLDFGEEYVVRVWNHGKREVFMGLYIDGVNTIGAEREKPEVTPTNRNWFLKPDPESRKISGWQKVDPKTRQATYEKFVIVGAEDAVAHATPHPGGDGFGDSLGLVTAMFYTYGTDDIPKSKGVAQITHDTIGTGRGKKEVGGVSGFDPNAKQKGLLLSGMTIYYRSTQWFEKNSGTPAAAEVAAGPKPETPTTVEANKPSEKPKTAEKPAKPKVKDSEDDIPK